ncbi:flagellar biosynthesis protein FlhF [Cohnella endophytica]|uniref:Flagellar biosynthesis protein FlhF n=1 Tax=Cohnella endophytica TaxID=2419778 RepID=A0A494XY14_9BACL|nr:flagellar biosynthesis protein FlhF [Cohnella endophytica]RKP55475.1 flagellar biosynthesis protein FlhF [Cohnella endophytica]
MKVKRYIVDDLPEAVQMIRSELGSDAVILNTKEIRVGGFLGMFRKKRVEVIAAIDEIAKKPAARPQLPSRPIEKRPVSPVLQTMQDQEPTSPLLPPTAIRQRYSQPPFADSGRSPAPVQELPRESGLGNGTTTSPFQSNLEQVVALQEREADPNARESFPMHQRGDTQAATLAAAVHALESRESKPSAPADENSSLLQEIRSMKEMMTKLSKQQTFRTMPDSVMKLSRRLAEQGVEPGYVEQFAETVNAKLDNNEDDDSNAAYEAAREVLLSWIQGTKGEGIQPETRIVHFVGPTGVGKTTTIAKLAAEQSFNHRRSVGFITADTYRIAAVDQLRTYADILNVPLEVVFSPSELARAYGKLSDRDLLFMDTAGRNYRNELFVSEVNSLLAPGENTETVLVLSMTHKYGDMKAVASQFAKYGVTQMLLTKFDETDSFGAVVNLVKQFDFSISYYTCGQAVPDDIRPFDPEDLVNRLLGEPGHD